MFQASRPLQDKFTRLMKGSTFKQSTPLPTILLSTHLQTFTHYYEVSNFLQITNWAFYSRSLITPVFLITALDDY